ncbi:hypothetical protein Csa_002362, partial [Cucumis sativus]
GSKSSISEIHTGGLLGRIFLEQHCFGAAFKAKKNMQHLKSFGQSQNHGLQIIAQLQIAFGKLKIR